MAQSENALADLISGALIPMGPPELEMQALAQPYQGVWQAPVTLTANDNYNLPTTLYVGSFHTGRLYLITTANTGTFSLEASADGGITWCSLPDFSSVALTVGNTAVNLPAGCVLLRGNVTAGASGWTGEIQFTLIA